VAAVIFIPGDFPLLIVLLTVVGGFTTALIIGAIAAGAVAAAGGTAYGIQTAVEGNWPWEDPEGWFTGMLKAHTSGIGQIVSGAQGEDTLVEQLKGEEGGTSRGGGTAGVLQGATGAGMNRAIDEGMREGREQTSGLQGLGAGGGGGAAAPMPVVEDEGPSRKEILSGAWKDIAKGAATSIGGVLAGGALGGLGSLAGAAGSVGGGVGGAAGGAAPAAGGGVVAPIVSDVAAGVAPAAVESVGASAPSVFADVVSGGSSVAGAAAPPAASSGVVESIRAGLQVIPNTIGDTATGILQQGVMGAGKGAISSLAQGEDPGLGALTGGVTGAVGGGFGGLSSMLKPDISSPLYSSTSYASGSAYDPIAPQFDSSSFQAYTPPSFLENATYGGSKIIGAVGGRAAGMGVNQAFAPSVPTPPSEPIYSSRPSYYDLYDIGGAAATYGQRKPYWS